MADSPFQLVPFISPDATVLVRDVRAPIPPVVIPSRIAPSVISRLGGAIIGGLTGGIPGAIAGAVTDPFGSGIPTSFGRSGFFPEAAGACPPGRIRIGSTCLDPGAVLPGGVPATIPVDGTVVGTGGGAVVGSFGIPALVPMTFSQPTRRCPPGAVLGKDELCYMKGSIPIAFRKWRPASKPPMSAADAKALRRISTLQGKVKRLAKSANLTCKRK